MGKRQITYGAQESKAGVDEKTIPLMCKVQEGFSLL